MQILALNLYTESQKSHNSYFVWCSYFKREQHSQTGKLERKSSFPSHGMVTSSRMATLWRQVRTFREGPHLSTQPRVCHVMYLFTRPQSLNKHVLSRLGRKVTWGHRQGHKAFKDVVTCSQYSSIPETGCRGWQGECAGPGQGLPQRVGKQQNSYKWGLNTPTYTPLSSWSSCQTPGQKSQD